MGISLTGLTPATTYDALIKVGDNGPITGALKVLSDGLGTNLPMEASTTGINFTGTAQVGGVGIANTTQVAAKQDTLVSGTNIKTINGTSVLGSGNIVTPSTSPSGVAGAIQFSNGSAFASDATNFFWDDTNNRLGIGTNTPASPLSIVNTISLSAGATNPRIQNIAYTINNSGAQTGVATGIYLNATETALNGQTHTLVSLNTSANGEVLKITRFGEIISQGYIKVGQSSSLGWAGSRSQLFSPSDGLILLQNSASTDFSRLQLGGTTSSFPAIKRNGTAIDFRLADDSNVCNITAGAINGSFIISANGMCSQNWYDKLINTIWLTVDNTTAKANFKTAWNQTGLPTTRPSTVGDIYIDTAANILANGDKILAIRQ